MATTQTKKTHNQNPIWNNKEFLSILLKLKIEIIER